VSVDCEDIWDDTEAECIQAVLEDHPEIWVLFEHPAVEEVGGVNPILHVLVEAVVENQIRRRDPPEAEEAFRRLQATGFGRHAARGAIANLFLVHAFPVLKHMAPFDGERYARQLRILGTVDVSRVGRNDPCPCGSGKKFKRCCLEVADALVPDRHAGWLLLRTGRYVLSEDPRLWPDDPLLFQMENRGAIAEALERAGHVRSALQCLCENVKCAREHGDERLLWNALGELHAFCLSHPRYAGLGLRVTQHTLQPAGDEKTLAALRCYRADLLRAWARWRRLKRGTGPHYRITRPRHLRGTGMRSSRAIRARALRHSKRRFRCSRPGWTGRPARRRRRP
jgi:hypothetical protein